MIRNFFIVAVRNFFKQHTQSILNVSGLAIGLACSMYVYLYALDELTFDIQHPDAENSYRLVWKDKGADGQESVSPWAILGWGPLYEGESERSEKLYFAEYNWMATFVLLHSGKKMRCMIFPECLRHLEY